MTELKGQTPKHLIFVYGTLMSPFLRRKSINKFPGVKVKTIMKCSLSKWKLFISEDPSHNFPFIRFTGSNLDKVSGEILEVNDLALSTLIAVEKGYIPVTQTAHVFNEDTSEFEYMTFLVFTPLDRMKLIEHKELKSSFSSFCSRNSLPQWKDLLYKKK